MEKRQSPPRLPKTPADKLKTARENFILAMQELARDAIPNNPYSALVEDVLLKWQLAGRPPTPPNTSSRFRFQPELYHAHEAAKRERRNELIEMWARKFRLVSTEGKPADWIVAYAQEHCQKLSGEWREGPTRLGRLNSDPRESGPARPWIGLLAIPMADPCPRDGETFSEFKKRARKALTAHFKKLDIRDQTKSAPRKQQNPNRKPHELDHYEWLLLRCCGWKLKEILRRYPLVDSVQAINQGIKGKAALLMLALPK